MTMLERDALKRYRLELGAAMVVYAATLFGSISFGKPMEPGAVRTPRAHRSSARGRHPG